MSLTHGLAGLANPTCLFAFVVYAGAAACLPLLNRWARIGNLLNSVVLTLGTPGLTISFALSAGSGLLGGRGRGGNVGGTLHAGASEIAALIVLAILLALALIAIEFAGLDTRGLPVYLVGIISLRLFLDAYAPHAPLFPGWLATIGIFALVAFFAILLRLAATEEAGDIAATLRREPETARALVKQCLTPAFNFIPAIVGVGLYGAVTGLR